MPRGPILDEGYSWVIFTACFVNEFISLGIPFSMGVYNVEYLDNFQESKAATGWILSINIGLLLGAGPVAAWLMERFSERSVACFGSILATIGSVSMHFSQNIYHLYVAYGLITGFGYCLVYLPSAVIVGRYFQKYRSVTTAVCSAGSGLAMLVMPFLYNAIIDKYTWRGSVFILAGVNLHMLVFSALLRPQRKALPELDVDFEDKETIIIIKESSKAAIQYDVCSETDKLNSGVEESSNHGNNAVTIRVENGLDDDLTTERMNDESRHLNDTGVVQCDGRQGVFSETEKSNDYSSCAPPIREDDDRNACLRNSIDDNSLDITKENDRLLTNGEDKHTNNSVVIRNSSEDSTNCESSKDQVSDESKNKTLVLIPSENTLASVDASKNSEISKISKKPKDINKHYLEETKGHAMFDFNFVIYFISNIFWNIGTGILVLIPADYLHENGTDKATANLVVTFGGVGSVIGGAVAGLVGNHPRCNRLLLYIIVNIAAGITGFMYILSTDFIIVTVVNVFFGMFMGAIVGLLVVLSADIIGIAKLGQAYGYLMLSNGLGNLVGLPLAGLLFDKSGNYRSSFALAGVLNILGGAVMLFILIHKRNVRKKLFQIKSVSHESYPQD